jgi:acyl-CoA thioester hydrolase
MDGPVGRPSGIAFVGNSFSMNKSMTETFEYVHAVADDEIDDQGRVNNVCYVSWMQDAAMAHSASLGWSAERHQQLQLGWVVRTHKIEYLRPAMSGDVVVVQTYVADMKKVTSRRAYQMVRQSDGEVLAKAETDWAFVSYATGKPTRIPAELIEDFRKATVV